MVLKLEITKVRNLEHRVSRNFETTIV